MDVSLMDRCDGIQHGIVVQRGVRRLAKVVGTGHLCVPQMYSYHVIKPIALTLASMGLEAFAV